MIEKVKEGYLLRDVRILRMVKFEVRKGSVKPETETLYVTQSLRYIL